MPVPAIADTLRRLTPAAEQRFGSLRFVPLLGESASEPEYRLYTPETEEQVEITEVSEGGSVPVLRVRNHLEYRVLLIDSQELVGLKQNRMVNTDVLVPAGEEVTLPVSCVERGRWNRITRRSSSGGFVPYHVRSQKLHRVNMSLATGRGYDADQGEVWRDVDEVMVRSGTRSDSQAVRDAVNERRDEVSRARAGLNMPGGALGVAVFRGGHLLGMDLFDRSATFAAWWSDLSGSYLFEEILSGGPDDDGDGTAPCLTDIVEELAVADWQRHESPGEGDDLRCTTDAFGASSLVKDNVILHMQVFPREMSPAEAAHRRVARLLLDARTARRRPPFPGAWWVVPRILAAGCYPGDRTRADAEPKLRRLVECGVRCVVNLQPPDEVGRGEALFPEYDGLLNALAASESTGPIACVRVPIRGGRAPSEQQMRHTLDVIDRAIAGGQPVYVHCWGGHGRTGTVIGCWLARHGLSGEEALGRLTSLRRRSAHLRSHPSPQTRRQIEMVLGWPSEIKRLSGRI